MKSKTFFFLFFTMLWAMRLASQSGLKAEYYDGTDFDRKISSRIDPNIDLSWNDNPPVPGINPHECSIRWTGILLSPESGTFTFSAKVDDGIRVWVGGIPVIDAWELHDDGRFTGRVRLEKGVQYDLKVEYFNALIEGEIRLLWELPLANGTTSAKPVVIEPKYFFQYYQKTPQKTPSKPLADSKKNAPPPKPKTSPKPKTQAPAKPPTTETSVVNADSLQKYIPKNVLFEKGKDILLAESYPELDKLAAFLMRNPTYKLKVEGHTDVIGDRYKNMILSQDRADSVARYLVAKGVAASRIEAIGYGSTRPLENNHTKEGNIVNRRVAFIIR